MSAAPVDCRSLDAAIYAAIDEWGGFPWDACGIPQEDQVGALVGMVRDALLEHGLVDYVGPDTHQRVLVIRLDKPDE